MLITLTYDKHLLSSQPPLSGHLMVSEQARIYNGFHRFTEIGQIFLIINIFLIRKKLFKLKSGKWFGQSVNILSELLRNSGKGTLGSQNSKKFPTGNRSVFILDPLLQRVATYQRSTSIFLVLRCP